MQERKTLLPIFFVIETSGGMAGERIAIINIAMEKVIQSLKREILYDTQIRLSVLGFSSLSKWYLSSVDIEYIKWENLYASGTADFGCACRELNKILLADAEHVTSSTCISSPIIILISLRDPTDDFINDLETLKKNHIFNHSLKAAIAMDDDTNIDLLAIFTGTEHTVINIKNINDSCKGISWIIEEIIKAKKVVYDLPMNGDKDIYEMEQDIFYNNVKDRKQKGNIN